MTSDDSWLLVLSFLLVFCRQYQTWTNTLCTFSWIQLYLLAFWRPMVYIQDLFLAQFLKELLFGQIWFKDTVYIFCFSLLFLLNVFLTVYISFKNSYIENFENKEYVRNHRHQFIDLTNKCTHILDSSYSSTTRDLQSEFRLQNASIASFE